MTEEQKEILRELLVRLNGKCSRDIDTCPEQIGYELGKHDKWTGNDCYNNFLILAEYKQEKDEHVIGGDCGYDCPCSTDIGFDVLEAKIHELLEED